ncbi:MAG: hypothetical protein Q9227_007421 [Pyrenula ochraceoflavens]
MLSEAQHKTVPRITKFTNCRLVKDNDLIPGDLWVDSQSGQILHSQSAFYGDHVVPDQIVDLKNRILAPGFIDVQINGAQGFDFSVPQFTESYEAGLRKVNQHLLSTGVTSYLPTVTSQRPEVYHTVLPHLGPSGLSRDPYLGAESLGAHVEGPYMAPCRNGIHNKGVLLKPSQDKPLSSLSLTYGEENLFPLPSLTSAAGKQPPRIKKITAAPELFSPETLPDVIKTLTSNSQIFSIGHSDATHDQAIAAVAAGANMITHLFNAMRPFSHRDPGIFGLLGQTASSLLPSPSSTPATSPRASLDSSRSSSSTSSIPTATTTSSSPSSPQHPSIITTPPPRRPFFGLIADGIHLSPPSLSLAHLAHPSGTILVTDAMPLSGLPDGTYPWTNGESITKTSSLLTLNKNGRIAGSAVGLVDCVNNFMRWTGNGVGVAVGCVTGRPAEMLGRGVVGRKGGLAGGMDADLVVLEEVEEGGVRVVETWKFGVKVWEREGEGK